MKRVPEVRFDVRCSKEELRVIDMRAKQQELSRSRYLVEAGLNVRGIADWRERSRREYGIFKLVSLINTLQDSLAHKRYPEPEALIAQLQELQLTVNRLLHFYETNELTAEEEALFNTPSHPKIIRKCVSDYDGSNSDEQAQQS